jgi:hypothetical protein
MRMDCCELVLSFVNTHPFRCVFSLHALCQFAVLPQEATLDNFDVVGRRLRSSRRRLVQARHLRWVGM